MRRSALSIVVIVVGLAACSGSKSPGEKHQTIRGTVIDERTGKALPGAQILVGSVRAVTNAAGRFSVRGTDKSARISVSAKYYAPASTPAPTKKPFAVSVRLTPIPVPASVTSNLTRKPLDATVAFERQVTKIHFGRGNLYGVGDQSLVTVQATGYSKRTARVVDGRLAVQLEAGPGISSRFLADAMIHQRYADQGRLVHSQVLKYVSRKNIERQIRKGDNEGYGLIRFTIKSVTLLGSWRFHGCDGVGVKDYKGAAAIEYTEVTSAPSGGSQASHGVEHLVRDKDGLWKWFPLVIGCS